MNPRLESLDSVLKSKIQDFILDKTEDDVSDFLYEIFFLIYKGDTPEYICELIDKGCIGFNHKKFFTAKQKQKNIDTLLDDNFDCADGVEQCSKCGSLKTITYNKQTRSADEGATVFIFCVSCKHRHTLNS